VTEIERQQLEQVANDIQERAYTSAETNVSYDEYGETSVEVSPVVSTPAAYTPPSLVELAEAILEEYESTADETEEDDDDEETEALPIRSKPEVEESEGIGEGADAQAQVEALFEEESPIHAEYEQIGEGPDVEDDGTLTIEGLPVFEHTDVPYMEDWEGYYESADDVRGVIGKIGKEIVAEYFIITYDGSEDLYYLQRVERGTTN
jgi:hypothetical protein